MKKRKKRSQTKYPGLVPRVNSRVRQEHIDYDYIGQLSDSDKEFLNKFTEEFYSASLILDEDGRIIPELNLHQTEEHKKSIYDANNARNRCQYGQIKAKVANTKLLNYEDRLNMVEDELSKGIAPTRVEDAYAEFLTFKEIDAMLKEYNQAMSIFQEKDE